MLKLSDKIGHCDIAITATNWDMYDTYQLTKQLEDAASGEKQGKADKRYYDMNSVLPTLLKVIM